MSVDTPQQGTTMAQPFAIAGWALDFGASQDAGVDAVHVWAYPNPGSGQPAVFIGAAFGTARADVGSVFGSQFLNSGYGITVRGLTPGAYQFVVYAHSKVSGTFNDVRTLLVTVTGQQPRMSIDAPGSQQVAGAGFQVAGWAIDPNAAAGSGVDAIHVWAVPTLGGTPRFVGTGSLGYARPDVGAVFGSVGDKSGYALPATLPAGTWDLVVYAHSSVTGTFNNAQVVRVTVR